MSLVLGERYALQGVLGEGGFGIVWRATDRVGGSEVAVKWMKPRAAADVARLRRELTALRVLRLPGVVRLLDHGEAEGRPYFVTELIEGRPFPGTPRPVTWEQLRRPVLAILDTVARIHEAGIVHRDLKPGNVLVDAHGVPTLLDFGLARGSESGDTVTATGQVVGTPRYMAPETLMGGRPKVAADLYAIAAMTYEALTGVPPHGDLDRPIMSARVRQPVTPLTVLATGIPAPVAAVLERMLDTDPARRFTQAVEVAHALRDAEHVPADTVLPWIGDEAAVEALLERVEAGGRVRLGGERGSGRTAVLRRLCDRLEVPVVRARHGRGTYAGLEALLGDVTREDLADASLSELGERLWGRLEALAEQGGVVMADDWARIDRRSRRMLERAPDGLTVVQVVDSDQADVVLQPLSLDVLRTLFHGPDRILHLQEDGARELIRRTGGLPRRIRAEVDAWVRAGLASWEDGRLRVTRAALDRLRAGLRVAPAGLERGPHEEPLPDELDELLGIVDLCGAYATTRVLREVTELPAWDLEASLEELEERGALLRQGERWQPREGSRAGRGWTESRRRKLHARIAEALPEHAPDRWRHLLLAEDAERAVDAALREARRLIDSGRVGEAISVFELVLALARSHGDPDSELAVLEAWTEAAFVSARPSYLQAVRYELLRARGDVRTLADLLDGALLAAKGHGEAALKRLDGVHPSTVSLKVWREGWRFEAARRLDVETASRVLDEAEHSLRQQRMDSAVSRITGWRSLLAYQQGHVREALDLLDKTTPDRQRVAARLSVQLNRAMTHLDLGELQRAEILAQEALKQAETLRFTYNEARAIWVLRSVAYRRGEATTVDDELVEATEQLTHDPTRGAILLNEAAIAWRAGSLDRARALSRRAELAMHNAGLEPSWALARCLRAASGHPLEDEEHRAVEAALGPTTAPGLRIQAQALVPELQLMHDHTADLSLGQRREILSLHEATQKYTNWSKACLKNA